MSHAAMEGSFWGTSLVLCQFSKFQYCEENRK